MEWNVVGDFRMFTSTHAQSKAIFFGYTATEEVHVDVKCKCKARAKIILTVSCTDLFSFAVPSGREQAEKKRIHNFQCSFVRAQHTILCVWCADLSNIFFLFFVARTHNAFLY